MNVAGVGTDIIEIERVSEAIKNHEEAFIRKVFTLQEQNYCKKHSNPVPHYAARFSAKEAVVKALGCGFGKQIGFLDIEILNDADGKPTVHFSPKAKSELNDPHVLLSISHCKAYVSTVAIFLK